MVWVWDCVDLIAALGTGDDGLFAVADRDVIPEKMAESDMMSAIQAELLAFKRLDNLSQCFGVLVCFFLLSGHGVLQNKKATKEQMPSDGFGLNVYVFRCRRCGTCPC